MKKIMSVLILGMFMLSLATAEDFVAGTTLCCEKTTDGAWCQNVESNQCDDSFRQAPTSCEATSYCKKGCCYNSQEGTCMENSPEKTCEDDGGVWADDADCSIAQCQLGCCLIGDQAAFVTQTRCKRLANLYGLPIDYQTNIQTEIQCIASITSDVEGACTFEKEFETTCTRMTKRDCQAISESEFYENKLCTDEKLGTNCAPTEKTTCVDGRDEVFFVDSCGNTANVYDASKIESKDYWAELYGAGESCNVGESNADSAACGNCDYYLGSTCKDFDRGEDKVSPLYGDNICRDLACEWKGQPFKHGETWCDSQGGTEENLPGSRYFRMVCYNGDVSVEPCADFRQETCIQSEVNGFRAAACRANQWEDCFLQLEEDDCTNKDRRDCKWISGEADTTGCVPEFSPGFDFWNVEGDAKDVCARASKECIVSYEYTILGGTQCVDNCECLESEWESSLVNMCNALGDCGNKVNFNGQKGFKNKDYVTTEEVEEDDE